MTSKTRAVLVAVSMTLGLATASAMERYFTYTYEPETMPAGALEYEQWVTLRAGRNKTVGQENYNKWELRHELEYGATDNYSVSLYINESSESFRDPVTHENHSDFHFDGISLENRYQVLNPANHPIGLTLYLEPRYAGDEAEVEERLILGQRFGDWKWALNLSHATDWADNFHSTEGEVELSFGLTRHFSSRWSIGLETRDHNELPDYRIWENTALYVGPVVTYQQENWWVTLTIMPQVLGANFAHNVDGDHNFELRGHERMNVRLIAGFSF